MPKVESIRPGGVLEGSVTRYPLADLLIGILRGNLSGRLYVGLTTNADRWICFKHGVPVQVSLSSRSGSAPATDEGRIDAGRALLVELFDVPGLRFRFVEGEIPRPDLPLVVLEPLPILFEGLKEARAPAGVLRFLEERGRSLFKLTETFPPGLDPFGWGPTVEAAVLANDLEVSISSLVSAGLAPKTATAAVVSLYLSGMISETNRRPRAPNLFGPALAAPGGSPSSPEERDASEEPKAHIEPVDHGLIAIPRVSVTPAAGVDGLDEATPLDSVFEVEDTHDAQYRVVEERLRPVRDHTYFQLLRVTPDTPPEQLERAYRFLVRRVDDEGSDSGWRATKELLAEAHRALKNPAAARHYASLVERADQSPAADAERRALEAEPKVERALSRMALGCTGEARYLLEWAARLDPTRADIESLMAMADHLARADSFSTDELAELTRSFAREVTKNPHDWRVKLCHAVLLAESGDSRAAQAILQIVPKPSHPMVEYCQGIIAAGRPR